MYSREYSIFVSNGLAKSYSVGTYEDLSKCIDSLYIMTAFEQKRKRPFYVENSFFNNEYYSNVIGKHFCIRERKVSDWYTYSNGHIAEPINIVDISSEKCV